MCTKHDQWFHWSRSTRYEELRDHLVDRHKAHDCHVWYIKHRWYRRLADARTKARWARNWVYISRFVSLAGVAVLPPIITLETYQRAGNAVPPSLALIVSVTVALSGGILTVARVQQRWRLYYSLEGKLEQAGWKLFNGCSFCTFRDSVEQNLAAAEAVYESSVAIVTAPDAAPQPTLKNDQDDRQLKSVS